MADWVDTLNYYDGALEGLLFKDGQLYHFVITNDSPVDCPRVYELRPIDREPTDEELAEPWESTALFQVKPVGTIGENELYEFPERKDAADG